MMPLVAIILVVGSMPFVMAAGDVANGHKMSKTDNTYCQ